jgi:hypothetical protein
VSRSQFGLCTCLFVEREWPVSPRGLALCRGASTSSNNGQDSDKESWMSAAKYATVYIRRAREHEIVDKWIAFLEKHPIQDLEHFMPTNRRDRQPNECSR